MFSIVNRMYEAYTNPIMQVEPEIKYNVEPSVEAYQAKPKVNDEHESGIEAWSQLH